MQKKYKQLDLFVQADLVNPAISADQYQLQHAHSNILKKPLDEVPPGGPPEALLAAMAKYMALEVKKNPDKYKHLVEKH